MAEARANSSLGGYDDEFVNVIDEDWQCGICQLPMAEPVLTNCGHRFCIQCLNEYFARLVFLRITLLMLGRNVSILLAHSVTQELFDKFSFLRQ